MAVELAGCHLRGNLVKLVYLRGYSGWVGLIRVVRLPGGVAVYDSILQWRLRDVFLLELVAYEPIVVPVFIIVILI